MLTGACPTTNKHRNLQKNVLIVFGYTIDLTIGNLTTTTKFMTTTSVDWEKTGTRTSVSVGKRKLEMQSGGRSTTTTPNVNSNVKL